MRSFAVIAMAASASAYAYNPTYNVSSSAVESYAVSTPVYDASSVAYPVASSSVKYEEYPVTSTKVSSIRSGDLYLQYTYAFL